MGVITYPCWVDYVNQEATTIGQFCLYVPIWIIIYIHYKVKEEITYLFSNFNTATVDV